MLKNTYTPLKKLALFATLSVSCAFAQAASVNIGTFGSSANLDFQGSFVYALTMNPNAAGTKIGDATFTNALNGATPGVTESHQNYIQTWHPFNYTGADATALGSVMQSIIWNFGNDGGYSGLSLTMNNLQIGQSYQAQLLFAEAGYDRGFDVYQNDALIANDFSPYSLNNYVYGSAFIRSSFVADASSVTFKFGYYGGHPDRNPILNAATLERTTTSVDEPETLVMLLAGLGLIVRMKSRKSAAI